MPDPLFDGLYREVDKLRWPRSEEMRRRGHRAFVRRRVTMAAATVLAVLAGGVLTGQALGVEGTPPPAATEPPAVSPSPSGPASPSAALSPSSDPSPSAPDSEDPPTASPDTAPLASAMLRVEDFPGAWEREPNRVGDGDWSFAFSASAVCSERLQRPVASVDILDQAYRSESQTVIQRVERYAAGDAERYLQFVRTQVEECDSFRSSDGLTIQDEGFAGAESVLVRTVFAGVRSEYIFVRQGDLVTEVWAKTAFDSFGVPLAQRAADRLCGATAC